MKIRIVIEILLLIIFLYGCDNNLTDTVQPKLDKLFFLSSADLSNPQSATTINSINIDGTDFVELFKKNSYISDPVITGDGRKIIYDSDNNGNTDIFSFEIESRQVKNLTNSPSIDQKPYVSIKNNFIVFQKYSFLNNIQQPPQIYRMNLDGTDIINLTNNQMFNHLPKIDHVNEKIYFIGYNSNENGTTGQIFKMDFDGDHQEAVTDTSLFVFEFYNFCISKDGIKVSFINANKSFTIFKLYVVDYNGKNLIQLTNGSEVPANPRFSETSSQIVFESHSHNSTSINIIDVNGKNLISVGNYPFASHPQFYDNDSKIIFSADNNGEQDIFTIDKNGTNLKNITNSAINDYAPMLISAQ